MSVPKFEEFLYPFLFFLKDKNRSIKELTQCLIDQFHLTKEDCGVMTKGGTKTKLNDRISWTRQYLHRALFIEQPERGLYKITQRGLDYVTSHSELRISDLMFYPEFADFSNRTLSTRVGQTDTDSIQTSASTEIETPTEQLENAFQKINNDLAADLLQKILEQSPRFFEQLVVDLLVRMGYGGSFDNSALVTPYSHDEGIDGIIYEDKLGLDKIYIQAKRYKKEITISRPQIQQFAGAMDGQKATKGVYITTSSYTLDAKNYANSLNKKIVLIDGEQLSRYMIEYNVGVSVKTVYELKRLDIDYFEE